MTYLFTTGRVATTRLTSYLNKNGWNAKPDQFDATEILVNDKHISPNKNIDELKSLIRNFFAYEAFALKPLVNYRTSGDDIKTRKVMFDNSMFGCML